MTPQQLAQMLGTISPAQLAQMPHSLLYQAREYAQPSQQGLLAPYEHRAFAREAVSEDLSNALPIAAGTLAYPLYKALFGARSAPSFGQVGSGLLGVGEGIGQGVVNRVSGLIGR